MSKRNGMKQELLDSYIKIDKSKHQALVRVFTDLGDDDRDLTESKATSI